MAKRSRRGFRLGAYLDEMVSHLRERVPLALGEGREKAIHEARVATRRLKAGLDVLRPVLSDEPRKRFGQTLRNLRRRLGPLRDLDVMIGHFEKLKAEPAHARAAQWTVDILAARRVALRTDVLDADRAARLAQKAGGWWALRAEVEEAREAVDALLSEAAHTRFDEFARRADHLAAGEGVAGAPLPATGAAGLADLDDPHALRIAGKALRYTLEMAQAEFGAGLTKTLATFKKMQDALGSWHDYAIMAHTLLELSVQTQLALHDGVLQRDVMRLAALTLARADADMRKFHRLWGLSGAKLRKVVRERFVLVANGGEAGGQSSEFGEDKTPSPRPTPGVPGEGEHADEEEGGVSESRTGPGPDGSGEAPAPEGAPPIVGPGV